MQGRHVRPVASPTPAQRAPPLQHLCSKPFVAFFYWFTFPRFSVSLLHKSVFYPSSAFDLLPECSRACPGRFRPGWPLVFSRGNVLSTSFFPFFGTKLHDGCIWPLLWPKPITFIVFSGRHFSAIMVNPFLVQIRPMPVTVLLLKSAILSKDQLEEEKERF